MPIDTPQPFWDPPKVVKDVTDFVAGINTEVIHSGKSFNANADGIPYTTYQINDQDAVTGLGGTAGQPCYIQVGYMAKIRNTVANAGGVAKWAVFVNENQMSELAVNSAPIAFERQMALDTTSGYEWILSSPSGFNYSGPIISDVSDVTTGITIAPGVGTGGLIGFWIPSCPADGFTVSVRYKSTHSGVQRKDRRLWVRVLTFR